MRPLILAVLLSLAAAAPAVAASCFRPPAPTIPPPATAREGQMLMTGKVVDLYFENMERYGKCLAAEAANATAEAGLVLDNWRKAVAAYNARVGQ